MVLSSKTPAALSVREKCDWLRLIRSEQVGPRTFWRLLRHCHSASQALEYLKASDSKSRKQRRILPIEEAERELEDFERQNIRLVAACEPGYPELLRLIDDAPPFIAIQGNLTCLSRPMVSVIGSRNASAAGLKITTRLAKEIAGEGFVIVSGFARGIDTRAHQAALPMGTIAVLAGGHNCLYPSENLELAQEIIKNGGALISEMPLHWEPRGQDFPRRNRIISGLSYGIIVIEGTLRSGSMITARMALEQGREVFAVPGSPLDPRAEGPNELIRDGATLCTTSGHVLEVIRPMLGKTISRPLVEKPVQTNSPDLFSQSAENVQNSSSELKQVCIGDQNTRSPQINPQEPENILILLNTTPVPIDEIIRLSSLPARIVQSLLTELEMDGKILRHSGNMISLQSDQKK